MVFKPFKKLAASMATILLLGSLQVVLAQPKPKQVKDQGEYDIFNAAVKEADPNKKIQLLLQWKEKYPDSDYKLDRQQLIATTYFQGVRNADKAWEASQELIGMDAKNFAGLFFLTSLVMSSGKTDPDRLDQGEKAARSLLANLDEVFAPARKPAQATDDQWKKERMGPETLGIKTIGWIQMTKKDYEKAEETFTQFLKTEPNDGQISYWLATVMLQQKKKEKQIPALWHLARAAHYSGPNALPEQARTQLQSFLEKTYVNYHGGKDGLPEMIAGALKDPFPPADLNIESASQRAIREEEELKAKDPQKAMWLGVKKTLLSPEGSDYFNGTLKGSALPKFKGKVTAANPPARPKELTVSITGDQDEMKLRLDAPHGAKVDPGTEIEFDGGVAAEFSGDPFMLTVDQEKAKVTGLPAAAAPARGAPKGGVKKAVGRKK